jgi:hypothetical protein
MNAEVERRKTNGKDNAGTDDGRNQNNPADVTRGEGKVSGAAGQETGAISEEGKITNAENQRD